eukprot:148447-Rhodomonas_salina.2
MLKPEIFASLDHTWGPHSVDRFASKANEQLASFNAKWYEPGVEWIDSLTAPWHGENNWAFPPPAVIPHVLRHLQRHHASATLIVPEWHNSHWWQQGSSRAPATFIKDTSSLGDAAAVLVTPRDSRNQRRKSKLAALLDRVYNCRPGKKHVNRTSPGLPLKWRKDVLKLPLPSSQAMVGNGKQRISSAMLNKDSAWLQTLTAEGEARMTTPQSLHAVSTTLKEDRRLDERSNKQLSAAAKEAITIAATICYGQANKLDELTPAVLELYFLRWDAASKAKGSSVLPADPWAFSGFLAEEGARAAAKGSTASVTDHFFAALNHFSRIANVATPVEHFVVNLTRQAIQRKLGYHKSQKMPLLSSHIEALFLRHAADPNATINDVAMMCRIAIIAKPPPWKYL